jgi:alkanesulfonate monooxygenase SsuD/methylene tetrahydromethanopterin reductase-like flavin-dependent oxidoreductase (luciferase family)
MLGLPFGTAGDRADRLEEACQVIPSLWTQARASFAGQHYQLTGAVAEPKPVQQPHPPIWVGGAGRQRTLRIAAQHASVWNAPGGSPEEVADLSGVLDRHCADIGRDPSEIRRSVQVRMPATPDELLAFATAYAAVGVTGPSADTARRRPGRPSRAGWGTAVAPARGGVTIQTCRSGLLSDRLPIWAVETELGDLRGLVRTPQRNLGSASASAMATASWR